MSGVGVARVLRSARDLMNTNGRHWVKGDMRVEVNEQLIEWRELGNKNGIIVSPKAQLGDVAFCAWGGIAEVADDNELRVEAMEALVSIIDPVGFDYYCDFEAESKSEYEDEVHFGVNFKRYYPTFAHFWGERLEEREEMLGDKIACWNDNDKRTWEEVRASLTKAAERAKRNKVTT